MTNDRIVGGEAAPTAIPWQVSVRSCQSGYCHKCGGTILDATTVLCAAHCFSSQDISGEYIMAGATSRHDTSGQTIGIANGVWNTANPFNSAGSMSYDFVILKLSSALTFNADVQPACLPEANFAPDVAGQHCFVSGWGTLSSGASSLPTDLQWVGVKMMTNSQCSNSYGGGITDDMICAAEDGKDSCQGDSGGPLVCEVDGKAHITGVVSWGIGCAHPSYPGVYSRVTSVLSWIQSNMG